MRFLLVLAIIGLMTYAILDVTRTEDDRRRLGLPTWLWVAMIIIAPGVGALIWLVVSRLPVAARGDAGPEEYRAPRSQRRPSRPVAPDDDPEFLAGLNRPKPPEVTKAPEPPTPPALPPSGPAERTKPAKEPGDGPDGHEGPRTGTNPGDTEDRA
ncbi:PLDc_N domain-containing protein [Occultella glacieicola]|uniref:PLDc_N domain-containing protein n=1 Tax=Occultella glacieicola TaxID=2518684 RepID=A0ABY2E178_9MICO|nr:PLD nuclease N-terminal domain-containing protein [Occultella glacieicola]TDE91700.1 PLDc_N domain-containing protein [Occultella glacieicola]